MASDPRGSLAAPAAATTARAPLLSTGGAAATGPTHEEAPTEVIGPSGRVRTRFKNSDIFFVAAARVLERGLEEGRTLSEADAEDALPKDIPENARDALRRSWDRRYNAGRPNLAMSILEVWWPLLLASGSLHGIELAMGFVSPPLIRSIVSFIDTKDQPMYLGILYATGYFLAPFFQSLFMCHFVVHCRRVGMRTWGATTCMVFEKTLKLSQPAEVSYGPGALANIMQVDTTRFDYCFFFLNFIWSMPMMLVVGVALLYVNLGVAALTPLLVMGSLYPINKLLVKKIMNINRATAGARDVRIKILTEVIHALRLIKMLGWEHQVEGLVQKCRESEMEKVGQTKMWDIMNGFLWQGVPLLLPLVTFSVFILLGGVLDPGLVFSSMALLDMIRIPMNLFPQALQFIVQVKVGLDRIETLLCAEEVQEQKLGDGVPPPGGLAGGAEARFVRAAHQTGDAPAAQISSAAFRWAKPTPIPDRISVQRSSCLDRVRETDCVRRYCRPCARMPALAASADARDVALLEEGRQPPSGTSDAALPAAPTLRVGLLEIAAGKLVLVCGKVGAGKSTLISGLLNEAPLLKGYVHLCGPVAYCAQKPWIMHGTVKDNILFGADDTDPDQLDKVIEACALAADLKELRDGLDTMIGERGINLSGGQKARIGLGRAAFKYKSARTFILDDPLSAVDMHVAKHLMDRCLGSEHGLLRQATRILVTHQLQYMSAADIVVVVRDGEIAACRPPAEFSPEELAAYELDVHRPTVDGEDEGGGLVAAAGAAEAPVAPPAPLCSGPPEPVGLVRTVSAASEADEVLRRSAAPECSAALQDSVALPSDGLSLGGARLLPPTPRVRRLPLSRSLSDGSPPEALESPGVLARAVSEPSDAASAPALRPEDLRRPGGDSPPTPLTFAAPGAEAAASASPDVALAEAAGTAAAADGADNTNAEANGARTPPPPAPPAPRQDEEEERMIGALDIQVWLTYAKAMGACIAFVLVLCYVSNQLLQLASTLFLASWSTQLKKKHPASEKVMTPEEREEAMASLALFAGLLLAALGTIIGRMALFRWTSLKVSRTLHKNALWAVLRSPMSWLDTTPTGRIINRFSQDMQKLDMETQGTLSNFADSMVMLLVSCSVVVVSAPYLIIVMFPLSCLYNRLQKTFRVTARELQRLASKAKSPIYQGLDEAIIGVTSIRAYEEQPFFIRRNCERTALHISLMFSIMMCNRWLCVRLRAVGTIPVATVAIALVVQSRHKLFGLPVTGAEVGLVLRYALQFAQSMEGFLQSLTQTELCLVAIERISGYTELEPEPELQQPAADAALSAWPSQGEIRFEQVTMRYRPDLPTVLNGISFTVDGGTRLGVVGRTGAGKSSLLQALFRMCPLEGGRVRIDGVDISTLGLHILRRRLAIIPQDPVGFTGTLQFNLDPFNERRPEELWKKLEEVQLAEFFRAKEEGLQFGLAASGANLSVGQMQLVCAARAFLRNCRILILDEATASVDFNTDNLIQQVLRDEVQSKQLTTVTIAHRINTILGSDNVLVMEKGQAAEIGPPRALAEDPRSRFYTFVHPTGGDAAPGAASS